MAGLLSRYFEFRARSTDLATEVRAGFTTFMVMAYIIFVNPIILGFTGVPGLDGKGLPFTATLTVTCLAAGLLSIVMGLVSNYPFALAAGMGLNAVVAFDLVAGRGLTWPQAMTVVFLEGLVITVLVLTRFREALDERRPHRAQARDQRRHRPLHRVHRLLHLRPRDQARDGPAAGRARDVPRPADRGVPDRVPPDGVAHGAPDSRGAAPRHSRDDGHRHRAQRAVRSRDKGSQHRAPRGFPRRSSRRRISRPSAVSISGSSRSSG